MSVTVKLYTNTSDRRVVAKSLTLIAEKSCEFKGDIDVENPVLILTGDGATYAASVNYVEIAAFNRKYFARCRVLTGGLVEVTCSVDILSSAWDYIKTQKAVIDRQESEYNLYLDDGTFQSYSNDMVVTKEFSGGFSSPSYVLVLAGG